MAEYKNDEPCDYIYDVIAVTKIVDGDTLDCVFDLGFDVRFESRVRLLGIDTPESRTPERNTRTGTRNTQALADYFPARYTGLFSQYMVGAQKEHGIPTGQTGHITSDNLTSAPLGRGKPGTSAISRVAAEDIPLR